MENLKEANEEIERLKDEIKKIKEKNIKDFSTKELHDEGLEDYIPFFSIIGDGNTIFCFDKNNRIVALDWYSKVAFEEDEMNFSDFLLKKIIELEERKTQMIETLENRKN